MMYLPNDHWSPRYDSAFYTVKVEGKQHFIKPPQNIPRKLAGKSGPAYYYCVVVYCEHNKRILLRRYSHFKWLFEAIQENPPTEPQLPGAAMIKLPPGTCPFQRQDEDFAKIRMEELSDFLQELLARPGYASHAAVVAFLELGSSIDVAA